MIDKRPALIARAADVISAVNFVCENEMLLAVRGEWSRDYWEALHPHSAVGAYVNMMMEESQERVRVSYRDNYERLVAVKNEYDPANLFSVNQNIKPTG